MRVRRSAAAALGLLAVLPALTACGDDTGISVGDVISAREDDQFGDDGKQTSIALPLGRLEVTAGEPTTKLAANDTLQLEALTAPSGSTFVPITWQYDAGTFGDYASYLDTDATPVIDLVADDAKYRLPAPESTGEGADSFYVLVTGTGEDPDLSVEFDGVTQTVDLATGERDEGDAAPLYDLGPRRERTQSCGANADFGELVRRPDYICTTTRSARIPYAGGAWAAEGTSWLVVTVKTSLRRYDEIAADLSRGAIYAASAVKTSFTLGTTKPTKVIEDRASSSCPDAAGCAETYHLIFKVDKKSSTQLRITQTYDLALVSVWGGGEGKDALKATVKIKIKLR